MKYIHYILGIILLVTLGVWGYDFRTPPRPADDGALVVNERVISAAELASRQRYHSYSSENRKEFLDDVITRELLIQEAKRSGIDREESFRRAIQDFFEQSLIKVLMERKLQTLEVTVEDGELEACRENLGKMFHLTVFCYPTEQQARLGTGGQTEEVQDRYLDLPRSLREQLVPLREGETSDLFHSGDSFACVRLDRVEPLPAQESYLPHEKELKEMLMEEKKRRALDQWLAGLRKEAHITIPKPTEEPRAEK